MNKEIKSKKNILIRTDFVIYNAQKLFDNNTTVKIPSYIIQDVIEGDKTIKITTDNSNKTLKYYTTSELKKNLVTVESRIYQGRFKQKEIEYNLAVIKL